MFDLRFHIASLMAVFLAFGIGLLVGSASGSGVLLEQQRQLVNRLEIEFQVLREDKRRTEQEVAVFRHQTEILEDYAEAAYALLTSGRLDGKRIALIVGSLGDYAGLADLVEQAGGTAGPVIQVNENLLLASLGSVASEGLSGKDGFSPITLKETLLRNIDRDGVSQSQQQSRIQRSGRELEQAAALALADLVLANNTGALGSAVQALTSASLVTITGLNAEHVLSVGASPASDSLVTPDCGVFLLGGLEFGPPQARDLIDNFYLPMLERLEDAKLNLVVTEDTVSENSQSPRVSFLSFLPQGNYSTVDNISTLAGRTSLVLSLSGTPGHYGSTSRAQSLIPAPPVSYQDTVNLE